MLDFKEQLKGGRLILKILRPEFELAQEIFAKVESNREYLTKWLPWVDNNIQIEDSLFHIFATQIKMKEGKTVGYGIFLNNEYIGNIDVFDINLINRSAEIGYWLDQAHSGNGYMTEAVELVEKEFFERFGFHRLQICCDKENLASAKVAKKCGYQLEGLLRGKEFVQANNSFRDIQVHSKLLLDYLSQ